VRDKRLSIAYMAQEIHLNPDQSAFEVVRQGAARVLALGSGIGSTGSKIC
jgi:hypothetical protein